MSVTHAIVGKLPPADKDALATMARSVADNPRCLTVVAVVSPKSVETEMEADQTGEMPRKVRFQFEQIEVVSGSDESFVLSTMKAAQELRTGEKVLDRFEAAMADGIEVGRAEPDVDEESGE